MAVERTPSGSSLIDVLDRVLDKGIVIDAWVRVSLVGIDLVTVEARIVVASIDTYLKYSEAVGITAPVSRPREIGGGDELERMRIENESLRRQLELRNAWADGNGGAWLHLETAPLRVSSRRWRRPLTSRPRPPSF